MDTERSHHAPGLASTFYEDIDDMKSTAGPDLITHTHTEQNAHKRAGVSQSDTARGAAGLAGALRPLMGLG